MKLGPYELNRVHQGDCLELMKAIPAGSVDAIVTDPPWPNTKVSLGWKGKTWWRKVVRGMERVIKEKGKIILHLGTQTDPRPFLEPITIPFVHMCFLEYVPPRYRGNILNHGDIIYQFGYGFLPKGFRVLPELTRSPSKGGRDFESEWFPCPRHQPHVDWILRTQVGPDRIVLDPFCGSGTTGISTIKADGLFIGFEINQEYCEKANLRIEAAQKGLKLVDLEKGQGSLFK